MTAQEGGAGGQWGLGWPRQEVTRLGLPPCPCFFLMGERAARTYRRGLRQAGKALPRRGTCTGRPQVLGVSVLPPHGDTSLRMGQPLAPVSEELLCVLSRPVGAASAHTPGTAAPGLPPMPVLQEAFPLGAVSLPGPQPTAQACGELSQGAGPDPHHSSLPLAPQRGLLHAHFTEEETEARREEASGGASIGTRCVGEGPQAPHHPCHLPCPSAFTPWWLKAT